MNALSRLAGFLLRLGLLALGFVLMLAALMVGLALAGGAVLWALVRGRRPALRATFGRRFEQARRQARRAPAGEVVDIEVREVR